MKQSLSYPCKGHQSEGVLLKEQPEPYALSPDGHPSLDIVTHRSDGVDLIQLKEYIASEEQVTQQSTQAQEHDKAQECDVSIHYSE